MRSRLPHHRRYIFHRRAGIDIRRTVWLVLASILLGLLIYAGEAYLHERDLRITRENEVRDLLALNLRPPIGAPGTATDYAEGTVHLEVRKP